METLPQEFLIISVGIHNAHIRPKQNRVTKLMNPVSQQEVATIIPCEAELGL